MKENPGLTTELTKDTGNLAMEPYKGKDLQD